MRGDFGETGDVRLRFGLPNPFPCLLSGLVSRWAFKSSLRINCAVSFWDRRNALMASRRCESGELFAQVGLAFETADTFQEARSLEFDSRARVPSTATQLLCSLRFWEAL
jgi:hypothetical protein